MPHSTPVVAGIGRRRGELLWSERCKCKDEKSARDDQSCRGGIKVQTRQWLDSRLGWLERLRAPANCGSSLSSTEENTPKPPPRTCWARYSTAPRTMAATMRPTTEEKKQARPRYSFWAGQVTSSVVDTTCMHGNVQTHLGQDLLTQRRSRTRVNEGGRWSLLPSYSSCRVPSSYNVTVLRRRRDCLHVLPLLRQAFWSLFAQPACQVLPSRGVAPVTSGMERKPKICHYIK